MTTEVKTPDLGDGIDSGDVLEILVSVGDTIAKAFDNLYYFERACETYITALMTGKPLRVVSDAVAEKTAQQTPQRRDDNNRDDGDVCPVKLSPIEFICHFRLTR